MIFDQTTLFTVATSITGLLGVFLLVLWLQERSVRALAWNTFPFVTGFELEPNADGPAR